MPGCAVQALTPRHRQAVVLPERMAPSMSSSRVVVSSRASECFPRQIISTVRGASATRLTVAPHGEPSTLRYQPCLWEWARTQAVSGPFDDGSPVAVAIDVLGAAHQPKLSA